MYGVRLVLISAALVVGVAGCDQEQEEKLQRAGEHFGKAVKSAADVALDAAEKAGDKVEQWTDQDASDGEDAVNERTNKVRRQPPSDPMNDSR